MKPATLFLAAIVVVAVIFIVRAGEAEQRQQSYDQQRQAYCQQYYANQASQRASAAAGQVATVGSMLNIYNC
jgi:hypothetical protein